MSTSKKGLALSISLFGLLISLALIVSAMFTSQGSAESSSIQYTTTILDPGSPLSVSDHSSPLPVKEFEVDRHYNYHIPSAEEVAATKQKLMNEDKFKEKAKKVGQQQAEKELDATLEEAVNYLKEKNQLGSEKIPLIEIGEHSAYISKYTYHVDPFNNCTGTVEDPVNMFFYDTGWTDKVSRKLFSAGWADADWPEEPQCTYTSSARPGPNGVGDLRLTDRQVVKEYGSPSGGIEERDHMRMWEGGWGSGTEGWWSIGAAHHEKADVQQLTHCLIPFNPNGSSFDLAEWHVWNDALGYLPHFFWGASNSGWWTSCGNSVWNDGTGVGVHITSDTLNPGDALAPGMARYSSDGRFTFVYQTDGNLVLYQSGVGAIWNTQTITSAGYAVMQTDGNFVLYNPSWQPYWATNTWGNSGAWLIVQNDGNVVIYRSNGTPMWWTGTCCR